jgi:drug/metabolite transporter (DMT)-like permease
MTGGTNQMPDDVAGAVTTPGAGTVAEPTTTAGSARAAAGVETHHVMRPSDWVALVLPGVMWGSSFFFIAEGLDAFEPGLIAFLRILFGFMTLAFFRASRVRIVGPDRWRVALLGVVWLAVPLSLFPFAEQRVSSSVTGMLNGATPLFVAVVAGVLARRSPPRFQIVGLVVGFIGVLVIAVPTLGEGSSSAVGVALIFGALACYGVAINLAVPLQRHYGALPVIWQAQAVAVILTAPMGLASVSGSHFAWRSALSVLALGALGTGAAYAIATTNAGRLGSTRASVTTYIIPVVSLILGVALRDEMVSVLAVVGCAIALCGAYLTNRSH